MAHTGIVPAPQGNRARNSRARDCLVRLKGRACKSPLMGLCGHRARKWRKRARLSTALDRL